MSEARAREEIVRVGRSLFERGYVHATAGNISVRLADGYLITPTDACLGTLDPARLARLDAQGRQTGGDPASKTLALHRRIYEASAGTAAPAGCVVHSHSTHLVACSLRADPAAAELLPPLTPYFVMKVGRDSHRNSLPARRAGSPVQVSPSPSTMYFTPEMCSSSATFLVVCFARSSYAPAQPTQNRYSTSSGISSSPSMPNR